VPTMAGVLVSTERSGRLPDWPVLGIVRIWPDSLESAAHNLHTLFFSDKGLLSPTLRLPPGR
jgi:hypothetical protein